MRRVLYSPPRSTNVYEGRIVRVLPDGSMTIVRREGQADYLPRRHGWRVYQSTDMRSFELLSEAKRRLYESARV